MKKIIKHIDKPLLIITVIMFIFGLIMVFSSSNVTAYMSKAVSPYNYFIKQGIFLSVGLIMALFMIRFNTKFYGMVSWLGILGTGISLIILLIMGQAKNQAVSWFDLGPISIQPSEFIKIIMIVWLARYYEVNDKRLDKYGVSLFPLLVGGGLTFLILLQPDLGTAIIFTVIVATIFLSVPISTQIKNQIIFGCFGLVAVVILVVISSGKTLIYERQLERLNFKRPCDRLLTTGSQVCNGYIAINNGGLTGVGLGNSTQKYLYLPEPYTDFIFAVVIEELGVLVGILLIFIYIFILYRILWIGKKSYTNRGAIICYGVAVYIFCHIAVNLMGLFGLIPMTGVPLPFMSYGGSFTICLIAALTLVQRVSVETGMRKDVKKSG